MLDIRQVMQFLVRDFAADAYRAKQEKPDPARTAMADAWARYEEKAAGAPEISEDELRVHVRGMIAAAAADGHIDPDERTRIMKKLTALPLSDDQRRFLIAEFEAPASQLTLSRAVTTPDAKLRLYAACLSAIVLDRPREASYLRRLKDRLGLADADVDVLHEKLKAPKLDEIGD